MGFNSQAGQVGFGLQSSRGVAVAATRFARLRSGSLSGNRDLMVPDPEIGGSRDPQQAYLGPISFSGSYEFYARMEMIALLLYGAFGAKASTSVVGASEVQTVTVNGTPTGGTFTLTYRGQTTSALAHNVAAGAVQTALEGLSTIGAGNVTVTGSAGGPYTVTFAGALQNTNPPTLVAVSSLTGGTNPSVAVTTPTPGYPPMGTHVITPADTIPWLTIEEALGTSLESFQYVDAKVGSLSLAAEADGYLTGSVDVLALTQSSGFTKQATPPWDTTPLVVGSTIKCYWNGVQLPAKSFTFELNNNIEDDDFRLGSISLYDLVAKQRSVTMGVTIRPEDASLWKAATYGDPSATSAQAGAAYVGNFQVVADTYETIQGVGTPFRLILDVPTAAMTPFAIEPSGDDVIEHDIEFVALRRDPLVPIVTATVRNDLATVA